MNLELRHKGLGSEHRVGVATWGQRDEQYLDAIFDFDFYSK
jgi:hypothetical protein